MFLLKKTLADVNLRNKTVLLRLDLNVPVENKKISDNNRILKSLPTLEYLLNKNCKIIILSHFSRIKNLDDINSGKKSLKLVSEEFQKLIPNKKILFIEEVNFDLIKKQIKNNSDFNIFILENTRYYDVNSLNEQVKWESRNFPLLSKFWSSLSEVFINDAFGTTHRSHASNVGIANIVPTSAIGFLMEKEIKSLTKAIESPEKLKVVILGGSKVSDKLALIKNIIGKVDKLIIGGGMAYTFLKAMKKEIGLSIIEKNMIEECEFLLKKYKTKIILPIDHLVCDEFKNKKGKILDLDEKNWEKNMALDIGPKTIKLFQDNLEQAKVVIWNGPMGVFEFSNFSSGTKKIAEKLKEITKKGAYTVVGGGDSVSALNKFHLDDYMSFISTGGGASLKFFEGSKMPGIDCIDDKY